MAALLKAFRATLLATLGFVLGALGISLFTGAPAFKDALQNISSLREENRNGSKIASAACLWDEADQNEQIFFIACGGIY